MDTSLKCFIFQKKLLSKDNTIVLYMFKKRNSSTGFTSCFLLIKMEANPEEVTQHQHCLSVCCLYYKSLPLPINKINVWERDRLTIQFFNMYKSNLIWLKNWKKFQWLWTVPRIFLVESCLLIIFSSIKTGFFSPLYHHCYQVTCQLTLSIPRSHWYCILILYWCHRQKFFVNCPLKGHTNNN